MGKKNIVLGLALVLCKPAVARVYNLQTDAGAVPSDASLGACNTNGAAFNVSFFHRRIKISKKVICHLCASSLAIYWFRYRQANPTATGMSRCLACADCCGMEFKYLFLSTFFLAAFFSPLPPGHACKDGER